LFSSRHTLPHISSKSEGRADLSARIVLGGYPEALGRNTEYSRRNWFGAYITTILQSDVRELANIEGLAELPRILALLAARGTSA
jgi:uncharacterized protein